MNDNKKPRRHPTLPALYIMVIGFICISFGVGHKNGWEAGVITAGIFLAIIAFLMALGIAKQMDQRGE